MIIIIRLVLSPCQTEKPSGGEETFTFEAELGQDKFRTVENKPEY